MPSQRPAFSSSAPSSVAPAPRHVRRYQLERELARGGMGVVYKVFDRVSGEARALKRVLLKDKGDQSHRLRAFEREYQVLAGLDHPRIIRVYDYGVDEEGPYYTMELLEGEDLSEGALPWRMACAYLRDVATSLALLHARRLLHRDLSPRNVKLTDDGHCKLLDFGALCDFGHPEFVVGTAPMIPPEALRGDMLDARADLYALGALAYWMLTGSHAYPAATVDDLAHAWGYAPPPPSEIVAEVPKALDLLVASLLSPDVLARPTSAAEVVARLEGIAELEPYDAREEQRLAQSFLACPRFVGRARELEHLEQRLSAITCDGTRRGGVVRIQGLPGSGRSRLLEEFGVRAQIAGAAVLRVDASMHPNLHGTSRALVQRAILAMPETVRTAPRRFSGALVNVGVRLDAPSSSSVLPVPREGVRETGELHEWLFELSQEKPIVIAVDNVEWADDVSLGLLHALALGAAEHAIVLVVAERTNPQRAPSKGLLALQRACQTLELPAFTAGETHELAESLFGGAPNVERFAEWLHARTGGSPLHCIEITRELLGRNLIQYERGMWVLPATRPRTVLPEALEDALASRARMLSAAARELALCLTLLREQPTLELCRLLVGPGSEQELSLLLGELAQRDVLQHDNGCYRFSSTALREALLASMDSLERDGSHRRLGDAFLLLASKDKPELRVEAGWHLIQGGDALRGATCIAEVMSDSVVVRTLAANLYPIGPAAEAALKVYRRYRRSRYARLPLLTALTQAGYYEEYAWGQKYGDEAVDTAAAISGVQLASRLRRFLGSHLALFIALTVAAIRFHLVPKSERTYSFKEALGQLFACVTTLTGAAAMSLDAERAARVASILEPFSALPERLTPVGIYHFCTAMQQVARERPAAAFAMFDEMARRFANPRYYPSLDDAARRLYIAGCLYSRGAFATFRADGREALVSADALEATGLKLYSMIASQLRYLYHANRGELALGEPHRKLVELHAAHVGSAWQVEQWEVTALLPMRIALDDVVGLTHTTRKLELHAEEIPSLRLYRTLSLLALLTVRRESIPVVVELAEREIGQHAPRSFIGWTAAVAILARTKNWLGLHEEAKTLCERALARMDDRDREYVSLFLPLELQAAFADAGLGDVKAAFARIDAMVARLEASGHPLALGQLHDARARIAWVAGMSEEYHQSSYEVERYYRATGTPALIACCERLAELARSDATVMQRVRRPSLALLSATEYKTIIESSEPAND